MNCNICGKDVFKHTERQVKNCLKKANIEISENTFETMANAGLSVGINYRHKTITYFGEKFVVEDVNEALLQMCLLGTNVVEEEVEVEGSWEDEEAPFEYFGDE